MSESTQKLGSDFRTRNDLSLGMRNNNPGNLRPGSSKWQGGVGAYAGFVTFEDISWGIRAFLINYYTQVTMRGRNTLKSFVSAYAPATENNTAAYIAAVRAATGLTENSAMPTDQAGVNQLMLAMFKHENSAASVGYITHAHIELAYSRLSPVHKAFFLCQKTKS